MVIFMTDNGFKVLRMGKAYFTKQLQKLPIKVSGKMVKKMALDF